jgi:hypothetical protein
VRPGCNRGDRHRLFRVAGSQSALALRGRITSGELSEVAAGIGHKLPKAAAILNPHDVSREAAPEASVGQKL